MKLQVALTLFIAFTCGACVSSHSSSHFARVATDSHVTLKAVQTEGMTKSFVIQGDPGGYPTLTQSIIRRYEVAALGVRTRSVDRALANGLGVEPWKGVLVESIVKDSAASKAEIKTGDVLLSIDDQGITNREQFRDYVAEALSVGEETTITVSRISPEGGREEVTLAVTLGAREVVEATTEEIELGSSLAIQRRTGMQVATISSELAYEIWAKEGSRTFVCGIVPGSPAYHAGLKVRDELLTFDGKEVRSQADILAAIEGDSRVIPFKVAGDEGVFESNLTTVEKINTSSSFYIPIIMEYSSRPDRTKLSVLDFIFQFGFNYSSRYVSSEAREPAKETNLSILPFGMFEFDRSPNRSKNTIFWFITWRTQ